MKIALLARNPHLYSHRRIVAAARERGHEIEVVNTLRVSINITSAKPMLYYRKRRLEDFDAVIPRIGASVTFYGLAVLRQFEVMGVYPLNESVAIGRSRDKLRSLQLLARRGIGLPVTATTFCGPDGRVRLQGESWRARCSAGARPGEALVVEGVDLITLIVGKQRS